jgi:hypothetical protein
LSGRLKVPQGGVRAAWLAVGWFGVALTIYLSLTPTPPEVDLGAYTDKWEHLSVYAVLMWWFSQLRTGASARAATGVALIGLGIALEFAQRLTEVRTFELADMISGALGVGAGWVLASPRTPNLLAWCMRRLASTADGARP